MSKQVWKFFIPINRSTILYAMMPADAKIVHVAYEGHATQYLSLWVEVDSKKESIERKFEAFGTGQHIPELSEYIGTGLIHNTPDAGPIVLHVYEIFSR